ncbi:DUF488 domain-containing protein [Niabella soli]|uniref:Uroporphyrin-III C-methyltransferase n=1 Tax=Niabella soli DSM 19437 TaxID=929713 RepID=W0F0P8_9BACT|nr:DUF488 domain-containing protein [Niabella soli]AHF15398.1 uroporphyrin-III C-methyltransferase [Niabella soli DSM 19437]
MPKIQLKRIYEPADPSDGYRVLVDRLWPRGVKKATADIDEWAKELAPSGALRKWFDHDPQKWAAFQKKYREELQANSAVDAFVQEHKANKLITLLYGAKDEVHNQAVVLKAVLEKIHTKK